MFARLPLESAVLRFGFWMTAIAAAIALAPGESRTTPLTLLGLASAALFHAAGAAALRGLVLGEAIGRLRAVIFPTLEGMRVWSRRVPDLAGPARHRAVGRGAPLLVAAWPDGEWPGGPSASRAEPAALARPDPGGGALGAFLAGPGPVHRSLFRRNAAQSRNARSGARRAQSGGRLPGGAVAALPSRWLPGVHPAAGGRGGGGHQPQAAVIAARSSGPAARGAGAGGRDERDLWNLAGAPGLAALDSPPRLAPRAAGGARSGRGSACVPSWWGCSGWWRSRRPG